MNLDECEEYAPAGFVPVAAHLLMIERNEALCVAIEGLRGELRDLRERLAEFERTRSTGGPAPAMTRDWGNEQHVPPPESAGRADMAPPARYGASNAERSEQ